MVRHLKLIFRLVFYAAFATVMLQNPLIFPGAVDAYRHRPHFVPPPGVESFTVTTSDLKELEVWRYAPAEPKPGGPIVVILHGNAGNLQDYFYLQQKFHRLGLISYDLEYRGYGQSTGWPTESGLYEDADAYWRAVVNRENVGPERILLFGLSLGSGPATYLAERNKAKTLTIVAGYSSIPDVVSDRWIIGPLWPFVWIQFPNEMRFGKLMNTCVVAAHGLKDRTIRPEHTRRLERAYRGIGGFTAVVEPEANHDDIIAQSWHRLVPAMMRCAGEPLPAAE